jgi:hypothetical protein
LLREAVTNPKKIRATGRERDQRRNMNQATVKPPLLRIGGHARAIRQVLIESKALLVHFDPIPGMGNRHVFYPENLRRAIYNHQNYELSCSVVCPGDHFDLDASKSNLPGTVGIIVRPNSDDSVFAVFETDHGNFRDPLTGKYHRQMGRPSIDLCTYTIKHRSGYNEWAVSNYTVLGILFIGTNLLVS